MIVNCWDEESRAMDSAGRGVHARSAPAGSLDLFMARSCACCVCVCVRARARVVAPSPGSPSLAEGQCGSFLLQVMDRSHVDSLSAKQDAMIEQHVAAIESTAKLVHGSPAGVAGLVSLRLGEGETELQVRNEQEKQVERRHLKTKMGQGKCRGVEKGVHRAEDDEGTFSEQMSHMNRLNLPS